MVDYLDKYLDKRQWGYIPGEMYNVLADVIVRWERKIGDRVGVVFLVEAEEGYCFLSEKDQIDEWVSIKTEGLEVVKQTIEFKLTYYQVMELFNVTNEVFVAIVAKPIIHIHLEYPGYKEVIQINSNGVTIEETEKELHDRIEENKIHNTVVVWLKINDITVNSAEVDNAIDNIQCTELFAYLSLCFPRFRIYTISLKKAKRLLLDYAFLQGLVRDKKAKDALKDWLNSSTDKKSYKDIDMLSDYRSVRIYNDSEEFEYNFTSATLSRTQLLPF